MVKLGSAFSDTIVRAGRPRLRKASDESPWWAGTGRALLFATLLCVGFFVLSWRLFDLTVVHGLGYRKLSDNNRTRELIRHAPRGRLLDRTGKALVVNIPQYRLLRPCTETVRGECIEYLAKDAGDVLVKKGMPPGEYLEVDYLRHYIYGTALSHVLGYTGELSQKELESEYYQSKNYSLGDRVGRMGAEEVFNERLRGRDGKEFVEVDAEGRMLRSLGRQEELAGEDITLSLDAALSQIAADAFPSGEKGAIIVSRPASGEILAMYSSPGFSPNAFAKGLSAQEYQTIINNPDLPMFNRSIGGAYPPGSTFKLVTALAGLEEGAFTATTTVEDNGVIRIGLFSFPNWYFLQYGKTEGLVDVVKALKRSNDIFFYKAGELVGITKLVSWAKKLGIGKPLGIELSGETGGLMPDPAWKDARFHTPEDLVAHNNEWYLGDTYHISIGQGYLLTTPLAVNFWTNSIGNGGKVCKPTIYKLSSLKEQRDNCKSVGIHAETIDTITNGMVAACMPGGTGWPLFNFSVPKPIAADEMTPTVSAATTSGQIRPYIAVPVACKTGTAEFGDPQNHTHAWFTAFAPLPAETLAKAGVSDDADVISGQPEISVTVLVEGAGEGSNVAAPIAKKILEEWFGR